MGVIFSVYVGPYAEWLFAKAPAYPDELYSFLCEQEPGLERNGEDPPQAAVGRGKRYQVCWHPFFLQLEDSSAQPPRPMHWSDWSCRSGEVTDLGEVSTAEELAWFARTFEAQLVALVRHYGKPSARVGASWRTNSRRGRRGRSPAELGEASR